MRKAALFVVFVVTLAACGGGSSSAAGTYRGTENFTFTIPGVLTDSGSESITVTIDAAGNVTVVDEAGFTFTGSLSGNQLTAQGTGQISEDGVTCSGPVTYEGTVSGDRVSGNVSGNATCSDGNVNVSVNGNGTFTATRV